MLVRLMLRTCLVEALKDRTSVGQRIYDSSLSTLPEDGEGPFLSIYTGQGQLQGSAGSAARSLISTSRCLLVFQYGVTAAMVETDQETDETRIIGFDFPPVDDGLQIFLDLVGRQIADALITPANGWGEMAQRIAHTFSDVQLEPGVSNEDGVRLATHQLSMVADLVREPADRNDLVEAYLSLLDASEDPRHAKQHEMITGLLSADMGEAERARRALGQSIAVWQAGPFASTVAQDKGELFDEAEIEIADRDPVTVTHAD